MVITEQPVPDYVRYISDWLDYRLPLGHCIVDKDICGCGYTEYCIRPENPYNVILCSPRIVLLKDKIKQHPDEPWIMYFDNDCLKSSFLNKNSLKEKELAEHNQEYFSYKADELRQHYLNCVSTYNRPCRILCTYDSFHTVLEALRDSIQNFVVVVDEFQSIFLDSFFKADVEEQFLMSLQEAPNVTYLSATPMLEKYLDRLDLFKNLPYYKLVWPADKVEDALIQEKWVSSIEDEAVNIVRLYKRRPYNRPVKEVDGALIRSDEVVFYVNSVSLIGRIIKRAQLLPSECNIICSDNLENRRKIQALRRSQLPEGTMFDIGEVPGKTEPHKMFTFCTSTVYLGADFYSTNAITVVLSDANIDSMIVDIRLDLPQILGRQRLLENPWKNECIVFYKTRDVSESITYENFQNSRTKKDELSNAILKMSGNLSNEANNLFIDSIFTKSQKATGQKKKIKSYYNDEGIIGNTSTYLSVTYDKKLVYNNLLVVAEDRAWELCQKDYKSNITVRRAFDGMKNTITVQYVSDVDKISQTIIDKFKSLPNFEDKIALYCGVRDKYSNDPDILSRLQVYFMSTPYEDYYAALGTAGCKAAGYKEAPIKRAINDIKHRSELAEKIYGEFTEGCVYTLKEIKEKLGYIFGLLGIARTPKATELLDYFNVQEKKLTDKATKKRISSYFLVSIKND